MNEIRLIDANALVKEMCNNGMQNNCPCYPKCYPCDFCEARRLIDKQSTIEAEPVRHGHLIEGRTFNDQRCSECGQVFRDDINFILPVDEDGICHTPKRCPECGAYWNGGA